MKVRKAVKYICIDIIMIILLVLFKVADTFIESFQLVVIADVGIGIINLMTTIIRKIRK